MNAPSSTVVLGGVEDETESLGCGGHDSDPLTPQRRGFIDTIFSPWSSLRLRCALSQVTNGAKSTAFPRRPPNYQSAVVGSFSADSPNAGASPFGGLPCVDDRQDGGNRHCRRQRLPCRERWWRWVMMGLTKCRALEVFRQQRTNRRGGGRGAGSRSGSVLSGRKSKSPVLLISVHQEEAEVNGVLSEENTASAQRVAPCISTPALCRRPSERIPSKGSPPASRHNKACWSLSCSSDPTEWAAGTNEYECAEPCRSSSPTLSTGSDRELSYQTLRLVKESRQRWAQLQNPYRAQRSAKHLAEYLIVPAMLQQILKDMFIDPELLAELDDEQKQILFCKLREEQIRRWKERETKLEEEDRRRAKKNKPATSKNGHKHVNWLMGADQNVWVWVMGEHQNDLTIEQIIEQEAQQRACTLATQEAEALAKKQEEEMLERLRQEQVRLEEEARQREAELRKKAEKERLEEERKKQEIEEQEQLKLLRARHERHRRKSIDEINQLKERRSSEIYMSYKETRQTIEKLAEEGSKELESEWLAQEKKAKAAEQEIRAIARRAREEHRRSLTGTLRSQAQVIGKAVAGLEDQRAEKKPPVPSKPPSLKLGRPPKPPNRAAIVDWYKEVEYAKESGINANNRQPEPWFHGIITRQDAEDLLQDEPEGTFLVRVSERIWGYAVSYRGKDRFKHFLIDTAGSNYQFFGTNQIAHTKLKDLVNFHKITAISSAGQEKLMRPCPQKHNPPNYVDLLPEMSSV